MNFLNVNLTCSYIPVEIIHAAGFIPRRLLPPAAQEKGLLPRNYCSYAKACAEVPQGEATVFTTCCDGLRRCYDLFAAGGDLVFLLDLPRQAGGRNVDYYRAELKRLAQWLTTFSAAPINESSLISSIVLFNKLRSLLKKIQEWSFIDLRIYELIQVTCTLPPEESIPLLEEALSGVQEQSPFQKKAPLFLTGTLIPDAGIFRVLEENNASVKVADFCLNSRFGSLKCSWEALEEDPWLVLASAYLNKPPCPRMAGLNERFSYMQGLLEKSRVSGVISFSMKFCDHGLYEIPLWRALCEQLNIPFLHLEGEYLGGIPAQIITRIQAFLETIHD